MKALQSSLQYKRPKNPREPLAKVFIKVKTPNGIPHSQHFAELQRPEHTEAPQWIIQATFITAFQVYSDVTGG